MKAFSSSKTALFVLFVVAFSILGCAPRRVTVVEARPRPAKVVVIKRPARTVVVRPVPHPHRVTVIRRR